MGISVSDFREGHVKNRDKLKNVQFSRTLEGNFHHLSLNGKKTPQSTILSQNALSDFKIEPENLKKKYVLEQILKHSFKFELLPISELIPKFDYAILSVINRSLVSQISFSNLISVKSYRGETFEGSNCLPPPPPPPPPLDHEGLSIRT